MLARVTVRTEPRSYLIHWPSPLADQRVARLPSTVLRGRLPSWVLAETAAPAGVISPSAAGGVGVGVEVAAGVGVGVPAIGVGVGVGGTVVPEKTLTSLTLLNVVAVLPCPT